MAKACQKNTMGTFLRHLKQSLGSLALHQQSCVLQTDSGGNVFKLILPKINRLLPMSNIIDCTKFKDNQSKQSELTAHTSFKNSIRDAHTPQPREIFLTP